MSSRSRDELDLEKVESAGDKGGEEDEEEEGEEGWTRAALVGSAGTLADVGVFSHGASEVSRRPSWPTW